VIDFQAHFYHSAPVEMHAFGFRLRANVPEGQKRFPISKLAKNAIPFELVVVGSYADCEQHLMEELRRYGEVIGRIPNGDLGDIYRRASCLVLPSRFDSFGQVVVEAMACGLPVIVTENVGARDLVESGKNGWVIPSNDVGALYQKMAECVDDPERLRMMGKAARRTAERAGWSVYRDRAAHTIRQFLEANVQGREENESLSQSRLLHLSRMP
jgi:glycosyltransferase involved in cell wall biosynthesis